MLLPSTNSSAGLISFNILLLYYTFTQLAIKRIIPSFLYFRSIFVEKKNFFLINFRCCCCFIERISIPRRIFPCNIIFIHSSSYFSGFLYFDILIIGKFRNIRIDENISSRSQNGLKMEKYVLNRKRPNFNMDPIGW